MRRKRLLSLLVATSTLQLLSGVSGQTDLIPTGYCVIDGIHVHVEPWDGAEVPKNAGLVTDPAGRVYVARQVNVGHDASPPIDVPSLAQVTVDAPFARVTVDGQLVDEFATLESYGSQPEA